MLKLSSRWVFALALGALGCAGATPAAAAPSADVEVEPTRDDAPRAIALQGVRNVRDLGGLVGARGPIPTGRFLRTGTLAHATEADKTALLAHGVTLDIDLRTVFETGFSRDAVAPDRRFHYEHISLFGVGIADWLHQSALGEMYVHALGHHQTELRRVFHELAAQTRGAVLFHCASGKDRTGVVTALLLSLAGVDRAAIIHDYALSSHYLHHNHTTDSPASAMERFLDVLGSKYGGARAYLSGIGLSDEDLRSLLRRLGQA